MTYRLTISLLIALTIILILGYNFDMATIPGWGTVVLSPWTLSAIIVLTLLIVSIFIHYRLNCKKQTLPKSILIVHMVSTFIAVLNLIIGPLPYLFPDLFLTLNSNSDDAGMSSALRALSIYYLFVIFIYILGQIFFLITSGKQLINRLRN